jgi:hypothetical protein
MDPTVATSPKTREHSNHNLITTTTTLFFLRQTYKGIFQKRIPLETNTITKINQEEKFKENRTEIPKTMLQKERNKTK